MADLIGLFGCIFNCISQLFVFVQFHQIVNDDGLELFDLSLDVSICEKVFIVMLKLAHFLFDSTINCVDG
jgi:hypothetical protein